eukprot:306199-Pyramimonas_sp.AAC.1
MRQTDASNVCESIPVITSPAVRAADRVQSSVFDRRAPDVFTSIPVITSHAVPPQPELSPDNRQHLASDSNDQ